MEAEKKCVSCHYNYPMDNFVGLKGQECKVCQNCRDRVSARGKLPEVKARKNELNRDTGRGAKWSKEYREKKRLENDEEYFEKVRQRRIKWRETWRKKNIENEKKDTKLNKNICLYNIKNSALRREIPLTISDEEIEKIILNNCFYCNKFDIDDKLNGIDRMNNQVGYTIENSVSCCKKCNIMKVCLDSKTFVERCKLLASNHFPDIFDFNPKLLDAWDADEKPPIMKLYKYRAKKKNLCFDLSPNDFEILTFNPCFYCKRESVVGFGLDRIDNSLGYKKENIVTCCSECNYMKNVLSVQEFLENCKNVAAHCDIKNIPEMPRTLHCITKRKII